MQYNTTTLYQYCDSNNIVLIRDYKNIKIKRENYIEGKCSTINCPDIFNKTFRQVVKTGAYCEKCIKQKATIKIKLKLTKFNNKLLNEFCDEHNIILFNDYADVDMNEKTKILGMCLTDDCEKTFSKTFRELLKLGGFCYDCCKEKGKIKIKNTNLSKYGVECCLLSEDIRKKSKHTIMEKYGVEFICQNETIKQNIKNGNMLKYGVEHVLQIPEIRSQIIETNLKKYGYKCPQQNKEISDKIKQTNFEKYGAENYFATKECQEQIKQTNLEKYGVEYPQQNNEIKERSKKSNLEKYGVEYASQHNEIKEKMKQTNLERYGVEYPPQNPKVAEKMQKCSFNIKKYTMPSGNVIDYQGYENFAYDDLLAEQIDEDDIVTNRKDVPEIWYLDSLGVKHRHYVDIYIKSQNRCIEVKSTWTANNEKNNVFQKQTAALSEEYGYKYEIWVYDKDGNKLFTY